MTKAPHREQIIKTFGNILRIRVSGICLQDNRILMVRHQGLGSKGVFWAPPGGGMMFGSSASQNLIREFEEETGLHIKVDHFLCTHEFLDVPLHAVELFFLVHATGGSPELGHDPEMSPKDQILKELDFLSFEKINSFHPEMVHQIFHHLKSPEDLLNMRGYYIFENNSVK
jgi:8-oxo-dGTP diphosphatase